ncbi:low molecular weight protein-tyrosine-phosphatase [Kangiella sediminilitoris]|uniref:Protein tyrosine phosphatase n=1 Tax=Kangiella sediminilitoris TaxID=1144748 RepID=A0A1B3BAR2_9GAMM|nr:low molecular weight protein-tyrosine-phosphatase [Kangiella sediminilitoris]AOE49871.1 Protein tyrosine phosphatase [Kangiella sediminilitoris]
MSQFSVLFVCLGNICRSPTAEGVFQHKVNEAGLDHLVKVDSAGTSAFHVGEAPDQRSQQEARKAGYDLSYIRSRKAQATDFVDFDLVIAMDLENYHNLSLLKTNGYDDKLKLFIRDYAPELEIEEVPDPYYGGAEGFTKVLNMIETASDNLLSEIKERLV